MASETDIVNDSFNVTDASDDKIAEWSVLQISGSIALYAFMAYVAWLSLIVVLAALNLSFGVRSLYIKVMLKMFEWGRQRIMVYEESYTKVDNGIQGTNGTYDEVPNGNLIARSDRPRLMPARSVEEIKHEFQLGDIFDFVRSGMEAIIEDEVTQRFHAEELSSWNLLTRTNNTPEFISYRLTIMWAIGFFLRYFILFPFRFSLAVVAISLMIICTGIIGFFVPAGRPRKWFYYRLSVTCYRIMARAFSAVITFHNRENRAKGGGICVANHTSPIDIIILGCDNTYAMVGQAQGGFFGIMQNAFSRGESHIWFNRAEASDRHAVARRLREHVEDKTKLPILIFPEGTCINNTSIMMFKKGSFETGGTVYPVAIKYNPSFADAFWNSSKMGLITHLASIMTSWALVCDVWYLPPEKLREGETSVQFANRVKADIARQGGLSDLSWDGGLKRSQPKSTLKEKQQEEYSKRLKGE